MPVESHRHESEYDKFAAHIQHETKKARAVARRKVRDKGIKSVGCVDRLTKKGSWNPPGGGIFLMREGLLDEYLQLRKDGTLMVHENCGYMRVVLRLDTVGAHKRVIQGFKKRIAGYNKQHGKHFTVVVESVGSAARYMR